MPYEVYEYRQIDYIKCANYAYHRNRLDSLKYALQNLTKRNLNGQDIVWILNASIISKKPEMIEIILDSDFSEKSIDRNYLIFSILAIENCENKEVFNILNLLVSKGSADINLKDDRKCSNGETLLHFASMRPDKDFLLEYLLDELKLKPDIKTNEGLTALDYAKKFKNDLALNIYQKRGYQLS